MRRIRFHYGCDIAGTDGYEDILVEDAVTAPDLDVKAAEMEKLYLPERGPWHEVIADDDKEWEGD